MWTSENCIYWNLKYLYHQMLFQTDSVLRSESRMTEVGGTVVYYCLVLLVLGGSLVQVCPQSPKKSY